MICVYGCDNGGQCVYPNNCTCAGGWEGPICTTPVCNPECLNNGVCIYNTALLTAMCGCIDSWVGSQCEIKSVFENTFVIMLCACMVICISSVQLFATVLREASAQMATHPVTAKQESIVWLVRLIYCLAGKTNLLAGW